ncbi:MAG: hypothetical protein IT271_14445 [Chitinophagales bacterium]|nr:hypothetical protein [Chitinophagales bacterium]
MNKKYYNLHILDNDKGVVSEVQNNIEFDYYFSLDTAKDFGILFKITEKGIIEDYLANDLGWPLMSDSMMAIFKKYVSKDCNWIKSSVFDTFNKKEYEYNILYFNKKIDVLDNKKSVFHDNEILLESVFSLEKIDNLDYFPQADEYDFNIVISENLKNELKKNKITGVDFSIAKVN